MRIRVIAMVLMSGLVLASAWGQDKDESSLIATLTSNAGKEEKDAACHRLKEIGTARAVSALASCLDDDALSQSARGALQVIPGAEASKALIAAIGKTTGMKRVGVIDSLSLRREPKTVPVLARLLADPDPVAAAAAARGLGRIGNEKAVKALEKALKAGDAAARPAAVDGLLRCAQRLLAEGRDSQAFKIGEALYPMDLPERSRMAAYRVQILAAGERGPALAIMGITGTDRTARAAGLSLAAQLTGEDVTRQLVDAMKSVEPSVQVALLQALGQRGDVAAQNGVMAAVASKDPAVRLAALNALGDVGGAESVGLLVKFASTATGAEHDAACQALAVLHPANVNGALMAALRDAPAGEEAEVIKALAVRRVPESMPALLELAKSKDEKVQVAAVQALAGFGGEALVGGLIELIGATRSDTVRQEVEDAVVKIAGRSAHPDKVAETLLSTKTVPETGPRLSILSAAARIDFGHALPSLRDAVHDSNAELRSGAVRVFAQNCGMEAFDELLPLARASADDTDRTLVLRGYWRLVGLASDKPAAARFEMVRAGLAEAKSPESRKAGVALLADLPMKDALECAEKAGKDEAVRPEAELAMYKIAGGLLFADRPNAERVLRHLADTAVDESLRGKASAIVSSTSQNAGYIVPWLVSKAYRLPGKQAQDLFDIALGPEAPDGGDAGWHMQSAPADPASFWQVGLSKDVGGDHCVIYLKTQVFSERGGKAELEIGSDDGIKLWVNGKLVHANNAVRGFTAGQDRAPVTLEKGWNSFLAKISQHTAGCAMAVRVREEGNAAGQGLRVEAR